MICSRFSASAKDSHSDWFMLSFSFYRFSSFSWRSWATTIFSIWNILCFRITLVKCKISDMSSGSLLLLASYTSVRVIFYPSNCCMARLLLFCLNLLSTVEISLVIYSDKSILISFLNDLKSSFYFWIKVLFSSSSFLNSYRISFRIQFSIM